MMIIIIIIIIGYIEKRRRKNIKREGGLENRVKERILYDNEREIEKETGIQRSKSVETTSKYSLCKEAFISCL